jgi:Ca2+-binding EF-hand superfamily protein
MMPNKSVALLFTAALALAAASVVVAQNAGVAAKPAIAVGEPDPTAHRLPAHPPQEPQVDAVFNAWDTDHNGSLSKQEFIAGSQQLRRESAVAQQLHAQFNTLDADKSGALDAHEYAQMQLIKRAGASAPSFSSFDANKNGRLDFAEYVKVVRQLAAKSAPATTAPAKKP